MATLNDAIALLEQGDWQAAHDMVQNDSSAFGSWAHGIVHILEGDLANAGYWYRRADRSLPDDADRPAHVAAEIAALAQALHESGV